MSRTYSWDDTYCPKGHGDWIFIPASTLYSDIYWCEKCAVFYQPYTRKVTPETLNKEFSSDRADALIRRARFLQWKSALQQSDMQKANP